MATHDLISALHCPCCGTGLREEGADTRHSETVRYGVLRCACYRYPVIEGIPILWQKSGPADINDEAVARIDAGDFEGARRSALARTSVARSEQWKKKLGRMVQRWRGTKQLFSRSEPAHPAAEGDVSGALDRIKTRTYADYLYYRYANGSFLGAIPLIALLQTLSRSAEPDPAGAQMASRLRLLDLACGVGHSTFVMRTLFPRYSVVAVDHDLDNLLIAQRYLAPDAIFVCVDAERPLPFPDQWFNAVFCLDAFHYLRSKVALVKELDRVMADSGLWLFPHLHNAAGTNMSPGIPLSGEEYLRCFGLVPARLLPESAVLRGFVDHGGVDLRAGVVDAETPHADVYSLVASRQGAFWQQHAKLDRFLLSRAGHCLAINPIYHVERRHGVLELEIKWPNPHLEAECQSIEEYLPRQCRIQESWLEFRTAGDAIPENIRDKLLDLIRSFVLVPLPESYRRRLY